MSDDDIKALREALAACKGRLPPFGALEVAASPDRIARLLDEVERLQQSHSALYAEVARAVAAERERCAQILDAAHEQRKHWDNHAAFYARMIREARLIEGPNVRGNLPATRGRRGNDE
jgi:uncharacterized membrane protein YccC